MINVGELPPDYVFSTAPITPTSPNPADKEYLKLQHGHRSRDDSETTKLTLTMPPTRRRLTLYEQQQRQPARDAQVMWSSLLQAAMYDQMRQSTERLVRSVTKHPEPECRERSHSDPFSLSVNTVIDNPATPMVEKPGGGLHMLHLGQVHLNVGATLLRRQQHQDQPKRGGKPHVNKSKSLSPVAIYRAARRASRRRYSVAAMSDVQKQHNDSRKTHL